MNKIISFEAAKVISMTEGKVFNASTPEILLDTGAKLYFRERWCRICGYANDGSDVKYYIKEYSL